MVSIVLPHPYHVSDESTVAVAHKYWICFHLHPSFFLHHDILPQFSVCFFLGFHVLWKQDATGVGCMDSKLPMASRVLTQQPFHMPNKSTTAVAHNGWTCFHLNPSFYVLNQALSPQPWVLLLLKCPSVTRCYPTGIKMNG